MKKNWKEVIELDLNHMNLSASDAFDCKTWRNLVGDGK